MSKIVWDPEMTDNEFVGISKSYFDLNKGIWNLHEGICLLLKMDPETKEKTIGSDLNDKSDPTNRYYKYALQAMATSTGATGAHKHESSLLQLEKDETQTGGKKYFVDARVFVIWATKEWPNSSAHLAAAEIEYRKKKALSGKSPNNGDDNWKLFTQPERLEIARDTHTLMMSETSSNYATLSIHKQADLLEKRLNSKFGKAYKKETLRKMIPDWT